MDEKQKVEAVKDFISSVNSLNYSLPTSEMSRIIHKSIREILNDADPYKKYKKNSNELLLKLYFDLKNEVINSNNPFDTSLRLAIAGNIIDYGASPDNIDIMETINDVLSSEFAIDNSEELKNEIERANTILYLGDNSGEIVLDKLFIETINHPNIYFAVRGAPVINDITIEDAELVGIEKVAKVISNGYNAPSTLLEKCSAEFLEVYHKADVVISKGQGNLKSLFHKPKNSFFLLMAKCDVIAELINVKVGDFVVMKNTSDIVKNE